MTSHHPRRGQRGYVMLALLLAVALVLITLSAGLPAISAELRRRREEELIHRGVQYSRAIRNYYHRFGTYPASLDQLQDSNHLRFLRRRYKDPLTDRDFRLLHVGEVQLSFRPPDPNGAPGKQSGALQPFVSLTAMGASGPAMAAGPIMGVTSTSEKQSFRVFNDKDHYNDWLFVYVPALERNGLLYRPFDGVHDVPPGTVIPPPQAISNSTDNTPGTIRPYPFRR